MNDQRKDQPDSERPLKRIHPKLLQTDKVSIDDAKNTNNPNLRRDLRFVNMLLTIHWKAEKTSQRFQRDSWVPIWWSIQLQREQDETER